MLPQHVVGVREGLRAGQERERLVALVCRHHQVVVLWAERELDALFRLGCDLLRWLVHWCAGIIRSCVHACVRGACAGSPGWES